MTKQSSIRTLSAGSIGNFGEIYDFAVFGFSVPILSAHFFPGSDRTAALLSTFAVYAVAFFARPLGGLLFGVMADKVGRVKVMAMTVWLMALGTAVIGLLPTYASIGIAAPALLVFCRIAQGLALGGETTGTTSFILESAPDDRRGGWIGLTLIFSHLPNALVAGLLIGLQFAAGVSAYADWVWRVPFLAGGLIGIVGFWLRRNLDEPDEYKQATRRTDSKNPLRTAIRTGGLRGMLNVAMIQPIQTVGSYLLLGFMYTFLVRVAKLDPTSALITNAAAIVVLSFMIPLGGVLSDRLGRKPVLSFGAAWLAFTAYPGVYLAATGTITGALVGQLLLAVGAVWRRLLRCRARILPDRLSSDRPRDLLSSRGGGLRRNDAVHRNTARSGVRLAARARLLRGVDRCRLSDPRSVRAGDERREFAHRGQRDAKRGRFARRT